MRNYFKPYEFFKFSFRIFQLISGLYLDTGILIWNGNGVEGKEQIQKFWMDLPGSDHTITTLDAQPITGESFYYIGDIRIRSKDLFLREKQNFYNLPFIYLFI